MIVRGCEGTGGGPRHSRTHFVLAGIVNDPLLGLAHNTEDQRLALLGPVCSNAKIDLLRAGVLLEGLCSTQGCQCSALQSPSLRPEGSKHVT